MDQLGFARCVRSITLGLMSQEIDALNALFAIKDIAAIVPGNGGLPKVQITSPSASGEIYLHGAQVTSWRPTGSEEVLFTSARSRWEEGRAIRGGIPVCFPWFRGKADNPEAPAHGFARTRSWKLEEIGHQEGTVTVTLATESDDSTRRWWPHDVRLVLRVEVGLQLKLALTVFNTGASSFRFEEALHTYHHVGDVMQVSVTGLDGVTFLDNTDSNCEKVQDGDVVMTAQTDNAYLNTSSALTLTDPVLQRKLRIEKRNSLTTVVWNPWDTGAKSMTDLGDEEWRKMACVEASNILSAAVTLAPSDAHTMEASIAIIG
jgi:glucose-6-phosphate 1-epimerase